MNNQPYSRIPRMVVLAILSLLIFSTAAEAQGRMPVSSTATASFRVVEVANIPDGKALSPSAYEMFHEDEDELGVFFSGIADREQLQYGSSPTLGKAPGVEIGRLADSVPPNTMLVRTRDSKKEVLIVFVNN